MSSVAFIVICIYMLLVLIIGFLASRQPVDGEGYYTGNRNFGFWSTTMSCCATDSSGWAFIGAVGFAYLSGIANLWMLIGLNIGYLINWFFIGPKLRRESKELNSEGVVEFISQKLNDSKKIICIVGGTLIVFLFVPYMASQLLSAGKTMYSILGLDYRSCLIFSGIFVVAYCFLGGYRSVIWTDTIQGTIMLGTFILLPIYLLVLLGGWTNFWHQIISIDPILVSPTAGAVGSAAAGLILGLISFGVGIMGQPHVLQRFITAKNNRVLRQGSIVATIWVNVAMLQATIVGLSARIILPNLADPEMAFPMLVNHLFPPILSGLIIGAVFAAIQSTYSSLLMTAVQSFANELLSPLLKRKLSDKERLNIGRISMVVLGLIAIILAILEIDSVFLLVLYVYGAIGAAFGPALILLLFWPKLITLKGTLCGMIIGAAVSSIWYTIGLSSYVSEAFPGMLSAALSILIISHFTKES